MAARDMRTFNTEGPVIPARHYCIPPLERLNLEYVSDLGLIARDDPPRMANPIHAEMGNC